MSFVLLARDRSIGLVELLTPQSFDTRQEALEALAAAMEVDAGLLERADAYVADLDAATPVLLMRAAAREREAWPAAPLAEDDSSLDPERGGEPTDDEQLPPAAPLAASISDTASDLGFAQIEDLVSVDTLVPPAPEETASSIEAVDFDLTDAEGLDAAVPGETIAEVAETSDPDQPGIASAESAFSGADTDPFVPRPVIMGAYGGEDAPPVREPLGVLDTTAPDTATPLPDATPGADDSLGVQGDAGRDAGPVSVGFVLAEPADQDDRPAGDPSPPEQLCDETGPTLDATALPVGEGPAHHAAVTEGLEIVEPASQEPSPLAEAADAEDLVSRPYEPRAIDMDVYTCDDCVYGGTCPKTYQDKPSTCGSFQWKAM